MSIAPERLSIGINRHFTQPDVHPYDMVKWEKRDARISNWKDGSVAFEQRDVEFPDTWSLNATNIVSQKYFRGTPGTSEREVSLRQVIDRVADTIANWGIQGGYFVDEAEAEAFRNELKYILVTQRAAFNSPVWFNIGVEGQLRLGALFSCYIGAMFVLPPVLHVAAVFIVAMTFGGLWAAFAAYLKVKRGVNEVISTIMLNALAGGLSAYLLSKHFALVEEGSNNLQTKELPASAQVPDLMPLLRKLGVEEMLLFGVHIQRNHTSVSQA